MNKAKRVINDFFLINPDYIDCKVELIQSGHRRDTYELTSRNNKKCILKMQKETGDVFTGSNDVLMQSFLRYSGINFVPEILFSNDDHSTYIESFTGEKDTSFNELDDSDINTVAKQLYEIHSRKAEDYFAFAKRNGFSDTRIGLDNIDIETPLYHLNTYGYARFEIVKKGCKDSFIVNWLETRLEENKITVEKIMSESLGEAHPQWGDIGGNLRRTGNKIFFTDFEHSRIGYGSELSYIKIHSHMDEDKFNKLVSRYSFYSNKPESELFSSILLNEKLTRINDVVWAAMKWVLSDTKEEKEKYRELTYKRLGFAEKIK